MELYQIRHFAAVAETGSFTKAAIRASVSQPALSASIAKLEEELGVKLFHRSPKSVTLTPAGRRFHMTAAIVRCRVVLSTVHFQLMCGPGPSTASSTAARHSRLTGRIGGIGAVSGTSVGAAIETMRFDSVFEALRINVL